jgi:amidase
VSNKSPVPLVKVEAPVKRAVHATAEVLRSLGHEVVEHDPDYPEIRTSFLPRWLRGIADDVPAVLADPERIERRTKSLAGLGRRISDGALAKAREREHGIAARILAVYERFDVLLTPTIPHPPREVGRYDGRGWLWTTMGAANTAPFTTPWNTTGQPAMSVPAPSLYDGVPLAVQLVGRPGDEATLISLGAQLEAEVGWPERRPPVD